jgi:hypothetical protein
MGRPGIDVAKIAMDRLNGFDPSRPDGSLPFDLETLLTHKDGLGLTTATPLQRAICRILDGTPLYELEYDPTVIEAFGGHVPVVGGIPQEALLLSAIRSGKSLIAACRAVQMALACNVDGLVAGEVPRTPIISLSKDLANVVFGYVVALCQGPLLRHRVQGTPTADTIVLKHPKGRNVEIKVSAGSRAGASVVARWLAGIVFDEAPRMLGAEDGVINLDDTRQAALGRILPNTSILYVGSPWAPFGPVFEYFKKHHGKPTIDFVVCKCPGWIINPKYWTKERCADLQSRDPGAYETDCAAEFADKVLSYMSSDLINQAIRVGVWQEMPQPGWEYVAAIDPATRGNAWVFGIAALSPMGVKRLVVAKQWQGTATHPLSPSKVFEEMVHTLRQYRVSRVFTDQWSFDSLADNAREHGIYLTSVTSTQQAKADWYASLNAGLVDKKVSFVEVPDLATDLKRVQRKITQTGISIVLPKTGDGRHCDYAAMIALLFSRYFPEPGMSTEVETNQSDWEKRVLDKLSKQISNDDPYGGGGGRWNNDL